MKKRVLLLLLLFTILFSVSANAFSMSPGSFRFEYDEINGLSETFSFVLKSSSNQPIVLDIGVSDHLAKYIELDISELKLNPGEIKQVDVKLNIPANLDEVGVQEAKITFTKKVQGDQGGFMSVTTALKARILITFAYPGEYISIIRLDPVSVNHGEDTTIAWEVQAKGTSLTSYVNTLTIEDSNGVNVFTKTYPRGFLERNQRFSVTEKISSNKFSPGNYNVSLKAVSLDNEEVDSRQLRIGEEDINLVKFIPHNFTLGEIVMFSFEVENLWNGEFSNVYGVLDFNNVSATTKSSKLAPFAKLEVDKQFIDLRDFEEGVHNGTLTVFFDDNFKKFDVQLLALNPKSSNIFSGTVIISASIILLLIILVILIFLFKKSNAVAKNNNKVR